MNKLFHLKQWVSIPDAARHLSQSLTEPVSEADVLKFGLDGLLVLSVYLPNGLTVQRWEEVDSADIAPRYGNLPDEWNDGEDTEGRRVIHFRGKFLRLCNPSGLGSACYEGAAVLDLSMRGTEKGEIEQEFQKHFGGPDLVNRGSGYVLLIDTDGELRLADDYLAPIDPNDLSIRAEWREMGLSPKKVDRLSEVGAFVVRPASLARFLSALQDKQESAADAPKSAGTRQRRTLLTLIAALCRKAGIDPAGRGAAVQIASLTDEIGAPVTDDAIRSLLRELPDAIESRSR